MPIQTGNILDASVVIKSPYLYKGFCFGLYADGIVATGCDKASRIGGMEVDRVDWLLVMPVNLDRLDTHFRRLFWQKDDDDERNRLEGKAGKLNYKGGRRQAV